MRLNRHLAFVGVLAAASCRAPYRVAPRPAPAPLILEGRMFLHDAPDSGVAGISSYRFGVPVIIRGHEYLLMADYGSNVSLVTDSALQRIGLPHQYADATRVDTLVKRNGVRPAVDTAASVTIERGDTTFVYFNVSGDPAIVDTLSIGRTRHDSVAFMSEAPAAFLAPFDGLLGRDILSEFDLEFDIAGRMLRLYSKAPSVSPRASLPPGFSDKDCIPSALSKMKIDTAGIDSTDLKEMRAYPARRFLEEGELQVPVGANGATFNAMFDSGSGFTIMNWAAARTFGLDRKSPTVHPKGQGALNMFTNRRPASGVAAGPADSVNYEVTGLQLTLAGHTLPIETISISDMTFEDLKDPGPAMLIGLGQVRGLKLFFSYSTNRVCIVGH